MPPELHVAVTRALTYRADLDLVVTAPDGSFAAFATVWYDPVNRHGLFEPIGTDPAQQRRGLASAAIVEGMRRLRDLGAETVQVSTGVKNLPANRLYEALGFHVVDRLMAWHRPQRRPRSPNSQAGASSPK